MLDNVLFGVFGYHLEAIKAFRVVNRVVTGSKLLKNGIPRGIPSHPGIHLW